MIETLGYPRGIKDLTTRNLFGRPSHLEVLDELTVKMVKLDTLYCFNIINNEPVLLKLSDSVQVKSILSNNFDPYNKYIDLNQGEKLKDYYSLSKFKKLISTLDIDSNLLIHVRKVGASNVVVDGLHRASVLFAKGERYVRAAYVN